MSMLIAQVCRLIYYSAPQSFNCRTGVGDLVRKSTGLAIAIILTMLVASVASYVILFRNRSDPTDFTYDIRIACYNGN